MSSSNNTSLLHDEEKKRRFFWSFVWLLLSVVVVLPLTSFVAPFWLVLQIVEAFIPVVREVNFFFEKLLTWPRMMGVAIYESSEIFPNPLASDDSMTLNDVS